MGAIKSGIAANNRGWVINWFFVFYRLNRRRRSGLPYDEPFTIPSDAVQLASYKKNG